MFIFIKSVLFLHLSGFGRTVSWPANVLQVSGSAGLVLDVQLHPGSIGYVDYLDAVLVAPNLPFANLLSHDGTWVSLTPQSVAAAGALANTDTMPAASANWWGYGLINGAGIPFVNYCNLFYLFFFSPSARLTVILF